MAFWNREEWGQGESFRQRAWGAVRSQGEEVHDRKIREGWKLAATRGL